MNTEPSFNELIYRLPIFRFSECHYDIHHVVRSMDIVAANCALVRAYVLRTIRALLDEHGFFHTAVSLDKDNWSGIPSDLWILTIKGQPFVAGKHWDYECFCMFIGHKNWQRDKLHLVPQL